MYNIETLGAWTKLCIYIKYESENTKTMSHYPYFKPTFFNAYVFTHNLQDVLDEYDNLIVTLLPSLSSFLASIIIITSLGFPTPFFDVLFVDTIYPSICPLNDYILASLPLEQRFEWISVCDQI